MSTLSPLGRGTKIFPSLLVGEAQKYFPLPFWERHKNIPLSPFGRGTKIFPSPLVGEGRVRGKRGKQGYILGKDVHKIGAGLKPAPTSLDI